jgi:hypothetical protein
VRAAPVVGRAVASWRILVERAEGAARAVARSSGNPLRVEVPGAAVHLAVAVEVPAILVGPVQRPGRVAEVPVDFIVERVPVASERAVVPVAVEVPGGVLEVAPGVPVRAVGVAARTSMVLRVLVTGRAPVVARVPGAPGRRALVFAARVASAFVLSAAVSLFAPSVGVIMAPSTHVIRLLGFRLARGVLSSRGF